MDHSWGSGFGGIFLGFKFWGNILGIQVWGENSWGSGFGGLGTSDNYSSCTASNDEMACGRNHLPTKIGRHADDALCRPPEFHPFPDH